MAEALTGYPAKLDQVHAKDWEEQKQMWFAEMQKAKKSDGEHTENADLHTKNMRMERCTVSGMEFPEFAIALDRPELYEQYSHRSLEDFIKILLEKSNTWENTHWRREDRIACTLAINFVHICFLQMKCCLLCFRKRRGNRYR